MGVGLKCVEQTVGVNSDDLTAELDQLAAEFGAQHDCPSISWGVVLGGELGAHGSFLSPHPSIAGTSASGRSECNQHTVYRIASMTKAFPAASTLLLRDEGVLRLDDALSVHAHELAEVRGPTVDSPAITIRDLLTIRAGFITDDYWADRHLELTDEEFDEIIASGVTFAEPTGSAHEYSNFGFGVLGRVVHRASGQRIQQVISERLLAPLGMHDTTWLQPTHDRRARPLDWYDGWFHTTSYHRCLMASSHPWVDSGAENQPSSSPSLSHLVTQATSGRGDGARGCWLTPRSPFLCSTSDLIALTRRGEVGRDRGSAGCFGSSLRRPDASEETDGTTSTATFAAPTSPKARRYRNGSQHRSSRWRHRFGMDRTRRVS